MEVFSEMGRSDGQTAKLAQALRASDSSARQRAALVAGMNPHDKYVDVLVEHSAIEPDFFVRDMLTWALTRHDPAITVDRLLGELSSAVPQARSQSLHTLSKIGDQRAWSSITADMLRDADDEVARAAWRAAVVLAPASDAPALAATLTSQLGREGRDVQRSLSRALAALGPGAASALDRAKLDQDPAVRAHALATQRLIDHPDEDFDAAITEARRAAALHDAPMTPTELDR